MQTAFSNDAHDRQPIETAPKDGTPVMLLFPSTQWGARAHLGWWDTFLHDDEMTSWTILFSGGNVELAEEAYFAPPSHWIPVSLPLDAHNARLSDNESGTSATDDAKETGKTTGDNT